MSMKMFPRFILILAAFVSVSATALAKPKPKPAPAPVAVPPDPANPTEALAPYINNLDQLLALSRQVPKNDAPLFDQASGRMITLRASFAAEREKAAEGSRGKFDAAMATCDVLTRALNERQTVIGDLKSSKSVQGSGKMEEGGRKDNLQQGLTGGGISKAVGTVVERDREREAAAKAAARSAANDNAMTAMAVNRWNKRALELKAAVTDAYSRIH